MRTVPSWRAPDSEWGLRDSAGEGRGRRVVEALIERGMRAPFKVEFKFIRASATGFKVDRFIRVLIDEAGFKLLDDAQ